MAFIFISKVEYICDTINDDIVTNKRLRPTSTVIELYINKIGKDLDQTRRMAR